MEQLLSELKRAFTPTQNQPQNLPQLQTDLARVRQRPDEKVSEYGLRVTDILQEIKELIYKNLIPPT